MSHDPPIQIHMTHCVFSSLCSDEAEEQKNTNNKEQERTEIRARERKTKIGTLSMMWC